MMALHQGLEVSFVDTTNLDEVRRACKLPVVVGGGSDDDKKYSNKPVPKLIHLESPSNPLMRISDLKSIAEIAHQCGAIVSCDCTMMTPIRQQPLQLGVDIVVHSGTKFLNGTSDTMSGFVAVSSEVLAKKIAFIQNAIGSALAPFDCWLTLRGMKTLYIRLERQEINAVAVARFLVAQKHFIKKLHYAGLEPISATTGDDGDADVLSSTMESYSLHRSQASGPSTVISFETGDVVKSRKFVNSCKLFKITVSFGSCNSLVEMPCVLSHASIRKEDRTLPEDLIRLSIGIEHAHDLIFDLSNAINEALKN
jgi:cystathionine beta-lyase